jgi:hypothetical protein
MSCPNYNSKEWKDILAEANGNKDLAMELWTKRFDSGAEYSDTRETGEGFETEEEADTNNFTTLTNKLRIYVANKIQYLEKTEISAKSDKIAELKNLQSLMETLDEMDSINEFVKYAYEEAITAEEFMKKTLASIKTLEPREAIKRLTILQDYANNYNILDDISKADIAEYFSKPVSGITERPEADVTAQEMITYAITTRNEIKNKILSEGIPLMADMLLEYAPSSVKAKVQDEIDSLNRRIDDITKSTKLSDEQKARIIAERRKEMDEFRSFTLDKQKLVDVLRNVSSDQTLVDFLVSPIISSPDSALSLFALALKTELEDARIKDIAIQRKLFKAFDEYAKSAPATRDNPAAFNAGIYEIVNVPVEKTNGEYQRDVNGDIVYMERAGFVQKYDISRFKTSESMFWKSLGPKPTEKKALDAWYKRVSEWYSKNKKPLSAEERQEVIDQKKNELKRRLITQEEYDAWVESVVTTDAQGNQIFMRELTEPSDDYVSEAWREMYDENDQPKNPKGKYHQALTEVYFDQQELLPETQRQGYFLPSVLKTTGERMIANAAKAGITEVKEAFTFTANDYEYLNSSIAGDDALKTIPVKFSAPMDASEISLNLIRSVMMFSQSANSFNALNKMHGEIKLFKTIIGDRKIAMTNSKGKPIMDAVARKLGITEYINQNGINFSELHLNAFVDMVVYGEMRKREEIFGINLAKITDSIMGYSAMTTLALSTIKGIANNMQGNVQVAIEAASSEFIDFKNLAAGQAFYIKSVPGFLSDFGKPIPESLGGRLVEEFDPMQGEYKDQYGKRISATVANKLFSQSTLFLNLQLGEHEIQVKTMFSMMDREKVIDNETGEEITLLKAYEKYGVDEIYNKTNFTKKQKIELQNRLHALNKRLHGVYNSFDQSVLQRYATGRLLIMYKKYLVPAYKRRFKKKGMDQELGSFTEGYYRTFWKTVVEDLRNYEFNIRKNWANYSPFQKAQIRRFMAEMAFVVSSTVLVMVLKSMADDDDEEEMKESAIYNHLMYQAIRLQSESKQYIPIYGARDMWRIVKSPSAVITSIDKTTKFINQAFVSIYDADERYYKRDTGQWEKGDNKTWAYFLKMMGLNGYDFNPAEAVKGFESTFR